MPDEAGHIASQWGHELTMTDDNTTKMEPTDRQPEPDELWTLFSKSANPDAKGRFSIALILGNAGTDANGQPQYEVELLFDSLLSEADPHITEVREEYLYAPLPEEDEWDEQFEEAVSLLRDYLTNEEVAQLLDGEPGYMTNGERGFAAARFCVLDGLDEAICENSRMQGHGPSRYARTVERYIEDKPTWVQEHVLHHETDIWDTMGFDADDATRTVEMLMLREEYLNEDHDEDIRELVAEYGLEYDEYVAGHYTAHDCPECGAALIERPRTTPEGDIVLDCSNRDCGKQYAGVMDDHALIVEREIDMKDN